MRSRFDEQLSLLNKEMIEMGALCENVISLVAEALISGDTTVIKKVIPRDEEIDNMEHTIESRCLKLLLLQQPVARDLRQISAALKMITDMERIGDQASDISEIIVSMKGRTGTECKQISQMATTITKMVTDSVDAYVNQDLNLAKKVIEDDDIVDGYFTEVKKSLINMIREKPLDGEYALDLLMIGKYFERIGDHAVNIAEWVEFSVTGVHKGVDEL